MFHFPPPIGFFALGTKVGVVLFVGQYGLKFVIGEHYFSVLRKFCFLFTLRKLYLSIIQYPRYRADFCFIVKNVLLERFLFYFQECTLPSSLVTPPRKYRCI